MSKLVVDWVPWLSGNEINLKYAAKYYKSYMNIVHNNIGAAGPLPYHPPIYQTEEEKKAPWSWVKRDRNCALVMVSGYFNPLHQGHLDLIEEAKALKKGHYIYLVVVVNTDKQVKVKKSCPFQDEQTRLRIVKSLKGVDAAMLAIDEDGTVAETIKHIRPHYFYNGGDRDLNNLNQKEIDACVAVNCTMIYGGEKSKKVASSSDLITKATYWEVGKMLERDGAEVVLTLEREISRMSDKQFVTQRNITVKFAGKL